jgi:hypothetical protein
MLLNEPKPIPANPKLWNSLRAQARAKFPHSGLEGTLPYPAAKWLKAEYDRQGGQYVTSKQDINPRLRDNEQDAEDAKKRKIAEEKRKKKKANLL